MTTAHTPTPWRATKLHNAWTVRRDTDELSVPIAEMWETIFSSEANASHIVKCVNMHDELVEALKLIDGFLDNKGYSSCDPFVRGAIREVLKKAGAL